MQKVEADRLVSRKCQPAAAGGRYRRGGGCFQEKDGSSTISRYALGNKVETDCVRVVTLSRVRGGGDSVQRRSGSQ